MTTTHTLHPDYRTALLASISFEPNGPRVVAPIGSSVLVIEPDLADLGFHRLLVDGGLEADHFRVDLDETVEEIALRREEAGYCPGDNRRLVGSHEFVYCPTCRFRP